MNLPIALVDLGGERAERLAKKNAGLGINRSTNAARISGIPRKPRASVELTSSLLVLVKDQELALPEKTSGRSHDDRAGLEETDYEMPPLYSESKILPEGTQVDWFMIEDAIDLIEFKAQQTAEDGVDLLAALHNQLSGSVKLLAEYLDARPDLAEKTSLYLIEVFGVPTLITLTNEGKFNDFPIKFHNKEPIRHPSSMQNRPSTPEA